MNQAFLENRQGKVPVAENLLSDDAPEVAVLRQRMTVCEEQPDPHSPRVWFIGYAMEFDPLALGERPPAYRAVFMRDSLGAPRFSTFDRMPTDPRISAWLNAGDEWLRRIFRPPLKGFPMQMQTPDRPEPAPAPTPSRPPSPGPEAPPLPPTPTPDRPAPTGPTPRS